MVMGQLLLPIFSGDTRMINMTSGVREHDGTVFYLHSCVPIFPHSSDDLIRFRFITSNLIMQGRCTNQEIADTFHVLTDSFRRWKKKFSEEGDVAFFKEESRHGRIYKLLPVVLARIQRQLDLRRSCYSIAKEEGISEGSIRYAISHGRLKKVRG